MAFDKGITVKTEEFTRMTRELKARLGTMDVTFRNVIDAEIAAVLEKAIFNTKFADKEKIKTRVANRSVFRIGGKRYALRDYKTGKPWRVPDAIWAEIEQKRERSLARKIRKIGLTKASFYHLGKAMGFELKAPAYVKRARATLDTSGNENNVFVARNGDGSSYGIRIENHIPSLGFPGTEGRQAFFAALAGRIGFYKANVRAGVFNAVQSVVKKYKGFRMG